MPAFISLMCRASANKTRVIRASIKRNRGDGYDPSDDAARASWGGSWRMPTVDDWNELLRNCSWNWTTVNGISGHMGTSRLNGNTIFLPAAGYRDGTELRGEGRYGSTGESLRKSTN